MVLELLAEMDLPALCQSLSAKSTHFTRVDDIIASAATAYGVTPPAGLGPDSDGEEGRL